MIPKDFQQVCVAFAVTEHAEVLNRMAAAAREKTNPHAAAFLQFLASSTPGVANTTELAKQFFDAAEQFICKGDQAAGDCDFARVVHAIDFLCYYSRLFVRLEGSQPREHVKGKLAEIGAILKTVTPQNINVFLDEVLNLNGRLRRRGYPLWLVASPDLADCAAWPDYLQRLGLPARDGPGFRFAIGARHLRTIPVVRVGEPDHDASQTMTAHFPTVVDGMWYATFVEGGFTSGGAREFVSKLDNTDAIESVEMLE